MMHKKRNSTSAVIAVTVLLNVLLLQADGVRAVGCPAGCMCNLGSVRCIRLKLTSVPDVPVDTTIIDLRFNHIRHIDSDSFAGLQQVHTIFLNDNHLSSIVSNVFSDLPSLKYLYLNRNRISKVEPGAFNGLSHLHNLYLNANDINSLEVGTFSHLSSLERLHLHENKISHLPAGLFEDLIVLKDLRLDQNPLNCDCTMLGLLNWLKQAESLKMSATCHHPVQLFGQDIQRLSGPDFKCMSPTIIEQPISIIVSAGEAATLSCRASGHPKPDISWQLNGQPLPSTDPRFRVKSDGSLHISNVDPSCTGQYVCRANNSVGIVRSRPARMTLQDDHANIVSGADRLTSTKPVIRVRPEGGVVSSRKPLVLHCVADGTPEPEIAWYHNGRPVATQSTDASLVHTNGTLVVTEPEMEDSGEYMCKATSVLGTATFRTEVTVNVAPIITLAPEDRTSKVGDYVTLECDADGFPIPRISWLLNGRFLEQSNRISFKQENAEVHIQPIKESDSGVYVCLAENEDGTAEASAHIVVDAEPELLAGSPKFLIEPYDIEALPGTTIEIPCQVEGNPVPQVKWKKDGRTLPSSAAKYRVLPSGSLQVKDIVALDAGRYECSAINVHGRQTGSGVVTIQTNDILLPGDKYIHIAYKEASEEIDRAINQTVASLFGAGPDEAKRHREMFKVFRYPNAQTRELARAAEIYERTLTNIRKHVDGGASINGTLSQFDYKDILSPEHLSLVAELSGCQAHRVIPNCTNMCYHLKYRSVDGTCNNLQHSTWGASLTGFRRVLDPIYENGFSTPIGWNKGKLYHGFVKPSARLVSTEVISTKNITKDVEITHMVMQWGQFLDHDLDHAIPSVSSESWDGIDCKKSCEYAAPCYPIEVPPNDPRVKNRRCIDLVRSSAICGSGMTSVFFDAVQPREQINQLTAYIDASQVYGYTTQFSRDLRNLTSEEGLLRVGVTFPKQKPLLPFAAPTDGIDCRRNVEESNINCFVAGDIRVNEQIGLAAMHTIWMREHNRVATELKRLNEHWDGETVYQEARKIVGAQMQHITYKHWLPNVLGPVGMDILGEYKGYDPSINPSISNEFATAALRFGHTLINPLLHRLNESFQEIPQGHLPLRNAFFAPWRLVLEGGVDPLLRGMFKMPAKLKMPTENLNRELTEKLFFTSHAVALDLAAINIQRARDHAIPGYNEYRRVCNLSVADTFDDLRNEISNDEVRAKLKELYGHPGNIDLFVGGILEDQKEGARVGPLFRCLLIEQFRRLRDGDRLWYENAATFTPEKLTQIKTASLAAVLCNNGDNITRITDNVFHLPETQGGFKQCGEIPQINLGVWLNCDKCSAHTGQFDPNHPPRFDPNLPPSLVTRQRRSVADGNNQSTTITSNHTSSVDQESEFVQMNDERIGGLETLIDSFQHTLKQMRKRLAKVEASCGANYKQSAVKFAKGSGHCVDEEGQTRLKDEVWMPDECTECHCKQHHQVNCVTQKCAPSVTCSENVLPVQLPGQCCASCPLGDK